MCKLQISRRPACRRRHVWRCALHAIARPAGSSVNLTATPVLSGHGALGSIGIRGGNSEEYPKGGSAVYRHRRPKRGGQDNVRAGVPSELRRDRRVCERRPHCGGTVAVSTSRCRNSSCRLMLLEIDRLASRRADFAIESTLSGLTLLSRWKRWKATGYRVEVIYLTLPSPDVAVRRIAQRVQQGGHAVPKADVLRRFERSWRNFCEFYKPIADAWMVYDNSGKRPRLIEAGP